jgi:multiple sugar transport system ATP-binding protein
MTMADKIVVMHDGIVEQMGTPLELYDFPANLFVAGFIGSPAMNFFRGRITLDGRPAFKADNGLILPLAELPRDCDGRQVIYGIRPEHFLLDPSAGIEAEVVVVEPMGSETQIVARLSGQPVVGMFRERATFGPGDSIRLRIDPARIHLFDQENGQRLNP